MQRRTNELWEKQHAADEKNVKRFVKIIDKYGWPGRSIAGKEGALASFFVIQHADLKHPKKYFPMMKAAVARGDANPDDLTLLEDRIRMREGMKQIYGTQLHFNEATKKIELWPLVASPFQIPI